MNSIRRYSGKFVSRIVKDFRHKELFPLKILFFIHASTLLVLYPYLTIHMRELGISIEETAIMSAVTPVIAIIMPPLAGMIADKIGNFKIMLSFFSSIGGLAALLLLLVPIGRLTVTYPEEALFTFGCETFQNSSGNEYGYIGFHMAEDFPCNKSGNMSSSEYYLQAKLQTCGFLCQSSHGDRDVPEAFQARSSEEDTDELSIHPILKARSYLVTVTDLRTKEKSYHQYNLTNEETSRKHTKQEALSQRFMSYRGDFRAAIRRISSSQYFLPAEGIHQFRCSPYEEDENDHSFLLSSSRFSRLKREAIPISSPYTCEIKLVEDETSELSMLIGSKFKTKIVNQQKGSQNSSYFKSEILVWNNSRVEPMCSQEEDAKDIRATAFLHNPDSNTEVVQSIELTHCRLSCLATSDRKDVCTNLKKEVTYNPSLTFWSYLGIRVFIGIIAATIFSAMCSCGITWILALSGPAGGTAFAMFEGAIIAILREQNADYGLQRVYASIGGMISSPLSGLMIDYASQGKGYTDFRPAFYLYAALKLLGGILMLTINLEFKVGAKNVISDIIAVLKKIEIIALLLASFLLGVSWGYIESFLFWLLQDLGGSRSLMGITITVGGIAGIPLLALSGPIIERIGHANVLVLGFIFYGIRLIGYSIIYNPWHCLIFEAMESVTTALSFTAAVTYAAKLSSTTTDSSIQGLLGGLYFGVGKGAGSLVGGYLMEYFGTRITFRIFAIFAVLMGISYFLFNRFYIQRRVSEMEPEDKEKKEKDDDLKIITDKPKKDAKLNGVFSSNNNEKDSAIIAPEVGVHDNPAFEKDDAETTDNLKSEPKIESCEHTNKKE